MKVSTIVFNLQQNFVIYSEQSSAEDQINIQCKSKFLKLLFINVSFRKASQSLHVHLMQIFNLRESHVITELVS